jgi:hypothetical protein
MPITDATAVNGSTDGKFERGVSQYFKDESLWLYSQNRQDLGQLLYGGLELQRRVI